MNVHLVTSLQVAGSIFALTGTWLMRKPGPQLPWGFVCWIVSNPCAMAVMAVGGNWVFFAQHVVFLVLALQGAWHWMVAPHLQARAGRAP